MARKKHGSSFKGKVTQNAHQQQAKANSYGHLKLPKGVNVFKEETTGRVTLDFLPYVVTDKRHMDRDEEYGTATPGELWYKKPYYLHRNIGPNNLSEPCPATIGKKCPVCEQRAKMLKEGAEWDDDAVKSLKASLRNLYVVQPKKNKKYKEEPYVWDISQFLFQDKLNEELAEDEAYGVFPDLEEGLSIRIRFTEEQIGKNKFADTSRIDFVERAVPYKESILDTVPNLDDIIIYKTYSELQGLLFGQLDIDDIDDIDDDDIDEEEEVTKALIRDAELDEEDEEEEEDDEADDAYELAKKMMADKRKAKKVPVKKSKAKKAPIVEEEEEDDFEDEDEEEPTPPPKQRRKTKKATIVEEEDDDDFEEEDDDDFEEEDEEEEVAKPVRKKVPAKSTKKAAVKKSVTKKKSSKEECPHGHEFGTDCEEYDECDECDKWEECLDAKG